jgi:hypothetical protein
MVIRCRKSEHVEEFVPADVFKEDLPWHLVESNHYWYIENSRTIEIRPERETWSRHDSRIWKVSLSFTDQLKVFGKCTKLLTQGPSHLVDPHCQLYRHLSMALLPLEPKPDGIIVTVEAKDSVSNPTVYLPRHDLTFCITPSSLLECQSFPGLVVDSNYQSIGTLIGLQTIISLRSNHDQVYQRKVLIPRGTLSSVSGLYGHPLTSIDVKDARGYFVYDIDDILCRLHGSRSIESDLFLALLHALTSSPFPDPLTRRTGSNEALDRLSNSSCYSTYSLSAEARSYLDGLASLTPRRTFYPPHLYVMETVNWHGALPPLSQHPYFLPLIGHILDYWRDLGIFHSFGDLLDPVDIPSGMNHLSARADTRNWVYQHDSYNPTLLEDLIYQSQDCNNNSTSRERERLAFQVACLSHPSTNTFPLCRNLRGAVMSFGEVRERGRWKCSDIDEWFPKAGSVGEIYSTLYELCRVSEWPINFQLTMTLGLLGYCNVSFELLATLLAVSRNSKSTTPNLSSHPRLDLALGENFDEEKIQTILVSYAADYANSEESRIQRQSGEKEAKRKKRAKQLYEAHLAQELNEAIIELKSQWPSVPKELVITSRVLLKPPMSSKPIIRPLLLAFAHNQAFMRQIDLLHIILSSFYVTRVSHKLYIPHFPLLSNLTRQFSMPTIQDLMRSTSPNSVPPNPVPLAETSVLPLPLKPQDTANVHNFFYELSRAPKNDLESLYLQNLQLSIDALMTGHHTFDSRMTIPSFDTLHSLCRTTREVYALEMSHFLEILLSRGYTFEILGAAGLLPAVTPVSLLQQLSLVNRPSLPKYWKDRLIEYAVKLHDAKRAERMVRLLGDKLYSHLLTEIQYRREWDPFNFVDWLLIEIDSNFSIRPGQADIAKEMIYPSNDQNSILQLNMGEGKSSVSPRPIYIGPIIDVSCV